MKKILIFLLSTFIISQSLFAEIATDTTAGLPSMLRWSPENTFTNNIKKIDTYFESLDTMDYALQKAVIDSFGVYMNSIELISDSTKQLALFLADAILMHNISQLKEDNLIYNSFSMIMVEKYQSHLKNEIHSNLFHIPTKEQEILVGLMAQVNAPIDIHPGHIYKAYDNLRKGNYGYVWRKATVTYRSTTLKYLAFLTAFIFILVFLIKFFKRKKNIKMNNNIITNNNALNSKMSIKSLLMFILFSLFFTNCTNGQHPVKHDSIKEYYEKITYMQQNTENYIRKNDSLSANINDENLLNALAKNKEQFLSFKKSFKEVAGKINAKKAESLTNKDLGIVQKKYLELNAISTNTVKYNKRLLSIIQNKKNQTTGKVVTVSEKKTPEKTKKEDPDENKKDVIDSQFKEELEYWNDIVKKSKSNILSLDIMGNSMDCFIYKKDKKSKISLFWDDKQGRPFYTFKNVAKHLQKSGFKPLMIMNAGMFNPQHKPVGLLVINGKIKNALSVGNGKGNFFLKPNGVLFIDTLDNAHIMTTEKFMNYEIKKVKHATQSGPMLVIDGKIHKVFNPKSKNFNIRNGAGIMPNGDIVFIITNTPIRFYDFAAVFRDVFGCQNALYLDGAISDMYANIKGRNHFDDNGYFGPMVAVYRKLTKKEIDAQKNNVKKDKKKGKKSKKNSKKSQRKNNSRKDNKKNLNPKDAKKRTTKNNKADKNTK